MNEILDLAVNELNKKSITQGKEVIDSLIKKDPIQTSKEEWVQLGKITAWFLGILALNMSLRILKRKFGNKEE